uniref:plasmolipin-like n=1 Tax=Myxine glutinosa TaxID=7769 RepID=UPI00358FDA90
MAEFPNSVNTQTSSPPQLNNIVLLGLPLNLSHLRSVPGLLSIAQLVSGLLVWSIVAAVDYIHFTSFGWLLFVSVISWIITFNLLLCQVFSLFSKLPQVPWQLMMLVFHAAATFLYFTALVAIGATYLARESFYSNWVASVFFVFLTFALYGTSTILGGRIWWQGRRSGPLITEAAENQT